ncbi:hypothetical protein [Flavobacterium sp. CLA17]|uniref:hypothetical protein n=1 Tax=Flavobacterium sp. CLA17 TaxID=2724135 RepID=UPI0014927EB1|nr:hypothetical protein [Flavobacterium sp. CLA17]QSB27603.1 hypothetical protein HAV12_002340 [Flavobacterium sp. CLA17]
MRGEKGKRPRINSRTAIMVVDPEEYIINCSSQKARKIGEIKENLIIHFYIGEHYRNRKQHGEDDGRAREDIEIDVVENLLRKALSHLIFYSLKHKTFKFISYPPPKQKPMSVVLKEIFSDNITLNVVAEFHGLEIGQYEITIRTAMRKDNYEIFDGDHEILFDGESSMLNFKVENKLTNIDKIQ